MPATIHWKRGLRGSGPNARALVLGQVIGSWFSCVSGSSADTEDATEEVSVVEPTPTSPPLPPWHDTKLIAYTSNREDLASYMWDAPNSEEQVQLAAALLQDVLFLGNCKLSSSETELVCGVVKDVYADLQRLAFIWEEARRAPDQLNPEILRQNEQPFDHKLEEVRREANVCIDQLYGPLMTLAALYNLKDSTALAASASPADRTKGQRLQKVLELAAEFYAPHIAKMFIVPQTPLEERAWKKLFQCQLDTNCIRRRMQVPFLMSVRPMETIERIRTLLDSWLETLRQLELECRQAPEADGEQMGHVLKGISIQISCLSDLISIFDFE